MIPNPYKECKYCGFNDHHSDHCEFYPRCEVCGSIAHEASDCPKKHPNLRTPRIANRKSKPTENGCSRHMTGVKQYLYRYSKESSLKVVFGDDSSRDTEGYDSVNCNGITFTRVAYVNGLKHNLISISQLCDANYKFLFTKTQGTIYNQNDEVFLIAPRRRDVYVIDMSSFNKESNAYFFAKASPSINWLWYKRLSHLNFKNINNLAKHNLVSGLLSLTFSKDKKIKMENLNKVKVKELRSDNRTEFRNHKLEDFCDEKGISQDLSSPCTPEQNGIAKRRNRTLVEAARTILHSAKLPKQF
ncbi:retrovirus-related pol polyprotein from transposon TNT 1-94 [Tanacetum coccineum]